MSEQARDEEARVEAAPGALPEANELLELIDRLEALLERSELTEIEVEAGGTALVLRTPAAVGEQHVAFAPKTAAGGAPAGASAAIAESGSDEQQAASRTRAVLAPLTGLFYSAPSPNAQPYLREGGDVQVGQVIGLIEAMKLFNEIKSDVAGRVVRMCVENGALVKAKQPLIEVEPA